MMPKKVRITQTLLEALLPVLGYFFWNWDTSFVLLWFALDWLTGYVITILKAKRRYQYSRQENEAKLAKKRLILGFASILTTFILGWLILPALTPNFSWIERIRAFLSYADMGIPQGIILIPLIVLNGYMLYNNQFVRIKLYERFGMDPITKTLYWESLLTPAIGIIAFITSLFITYPPEILLFGSIIGVSIFRLLMRD